MLIRSISGIRGLVDEDLKNDSIIKYANALNELFPEGVIYAGRDSRPSGEDIAQPVSYTHLTLPTICSV